MQYDACNETMAAAAPALAAGETADNDCGAADPGRSIAACTRIIDDHGASEQDRARAKIRTHP